MSWCSSSTAFPTPGTNSRDSIFGLEQTTRRSRQTTTIDYDLADFDEFGNDPGMYDVAGSPDTVNLIDDNDQGYDYQPGFDAGQTLFGPMYTVSPGMSKSPINSGGISDEVRDNAVNRQEGGPFDEGAFTNTNQEQGVKVVNSNYRITGAGEYNNQDTDVDEYNNQDADPDVNSYKQQDVGGNSKTSANKIPSRGETRAKGASSRNQKEAAGQTDPSEKDKNEIYNIQASKNSLTEKERNGLNEKSDTETRTGTLDENKSKKKTSGTNQFREKSFATQNISTNDKDNGTNTASSGSKQPTDSSGGYTGSGGSGESSNEMGSYSVYDSNSQEFSRSQSNERIDSQYSVTEEASSVEVLSAEDITREKQNLKEAAGDKSNSIGSTDIGSDSLGSQSFSSENGQQSSIEENRSHSSSEKYSSLTSDEYGSQSTSDENNSGQPSDEAGLQSSSDENIPGSTSDETRSQSDSDENMPTSSSDENNSKSSEKRDSQPSSSESTDKTLIGNENDIDYDNDLDNDYDNDTSSIGYDVNTSHQTSVEGEISEGEENFVLKDISAETVSYSTEGSGSAGMSLRSENDLSDCFVSPNENGKYCHLLRSLYNICKMQFKQECMPDLGESQQSKIDKVTSDSKSLNPGSVSDTSSESAEDPFPDSLDSSASGGSFSSSSSKPESMSLESVENLSASFEKTSGIFEVISLIRDACQSICALAESRDENKPDWSSIGNDADVDSSESSDEDDWIELSTETWTDSAEDLEGALSFSLGTASESSTSTNDLTQEEDASGANSGEYSVERNSNEHSDDVSYASSTSTESTNSAGSGSFEYDSRPFENTSD